MSARQESGARAALKNYQKTFAGVRPRGRARRTLLCALVIALVALSFAFPVPLGAQSGEGELDPSFGGGDGRVNDNFAGSPDRAHAVVVQPDGKIVVAVQASMPAPRGFDFGLVRYNADGSPDRTFGAGGKVATDFPTPNNTNDRPYALALQADGKIVVSGTANSDFALARYNPDGSLDITFDGDGLLVTDFFGGGDTAYGVAIQADGKIVAAGAAFRPNSTGADFAAARYNPDGSPDTTFGDPGPTPGARLGRVATDFAAWHDTGRGVALQADGKIVVAGYTNTPSTSDLHDFALVRYQTDGTLDPAFGGDGRVTTRFFGDDYVDDERAYAVRVQPDGKIVAAGFAWDQNETQPASQWEDFALARYNPDGSLDATFGGDGLVLTNIFVSEGGVNDAGLVSKDRAHALVLQGDGKLVASGFGSCCSNDGEEDFALARYRPDGTLDPTFGGDGVVQTDFFGRNTEDESYGLALQPDGRLVAVGRAEKTPRMSDYDFAVARYTGTPVTTPPPAQTHAIGGAVRDAFGAPLAGVTVTLSGAAAATATTGGDGKYLFTGATAGADYNVTPTHAGYTFTPASRAFSALGSDQTADFSGAASAAARVNHALSSNGGVASCSSYFSDPYWGTYPPSAVIDGSRRGPSSGTLWLDRTPSAWPDWVEVAFSGARSVSEVVLVTQQDDASAEPTEQTVFTRYGVTSFEVQYWNGSQWQAVPGGSITGNDRVIRRLTFPAVTTTKIRVVVTGGKDNSYSRLVEVEAWGDAAPPKVNHALGSNGGTASASSFFSDPYWGTYPASAVNDGSRRGASPGALWLDNTRGVFPDWVEVSFSGAKTITEVIVVTQQDNAANEPTEQSVFTKYGATGFEVQYWTGSAWQTVPGGAVTGNDRVVRRVTFSPVNTTKVRVVVGAGVDNTYSRLVEVEAY